MVTYTLPTMILSPQLLLHLLLDSFKILQTCFLRYEDVQFGLRFWIALFLTELLSMLTYAS